MCGAAAKLMGGCTAIVKWVLGISFQLGCTGRCKSTRCQVAFDAMATRSAITRSGSYARQPRISSGVIPAARSLLCFFAMARPPTPTASPMFIQTDLLGDCLRRFARWKSTWHGFSGLMAHKDVRRSEAENRTIDRIGPRTASPSRCAAGHKTCDRMLQICYTCRRLSRLYCHIIVGHAV